MNGPNNSDWENDPVWNLVDEAKSPEAGPFFARNVMREIRLAEPDAARPWWQRLLAPRSLAVGALGAAAAVAVVIALNPGPDQPAGTAGTSGADQPAPAVQVVEDLINEELLVEASEDPSAFSDEDLVAMLY